MTEFKIDSPIEGFWSDFHKFEKQKKGEKKTQKIVWEKKLTKVRCNQNRCRDDDDDT